MIWTIDPKRITFFTYSAVRYLSKIIVSTAIEVQNALRMYCKPLQIDLLLGVRGPLSRNSQFRDGK